MTEEEKLTLHNLLLKYPLGEIMESVRESLIGIGSSIHGDENPSPDYRERAKAQKYYEQAGHVHAFAVTTLRYKRS